MRFVADENLDLTVVGRLREAGHEVFAVVEMEPGIPDEAVLGITNSQVAMLVTEDKDFGELRHFQVTATRRTTIPGPRATLHLMTTVLEIERAIEQLPEADQLQIAEWFEEHRLTVEASAKPAAFYDEEDGGESQLLEE